MDAQTRRGKVRVVSIFVRMEQVLVRGLALSTLPKSSISNTKEKIAKLCYVKVRVPATHVPQKTHS